MDAAGMEFQVYPPSCSWNDGRLGSREGGKKMEKTVVNKGKAQDNTNPFLLSPADTQCEKWEAELQTDREREGGGSKQLATKDLVVFPRSD